MDVKNVVIINDFNYIQGGASKVAIDTAKLLKEEKLNVYFFSAVSRKNDEINGINYISTHQNEALKEKNIIKGLVQGIYNFKAKRTLKKLLLTLDKKETIIHVHGWTKALSSSIFDICFKMNFKVVVTLHDYFTACPNGGYFDYIQNKICKRKPLSWQCIKCNCDSRNYGFKLYRLIRQFVQNRIVKLNNKLQYAIGISNLSMNVLKATLPNNIRIEKIYNPIDYHEKEKVIDVSKNKYYLYVGRISKEKGVDLFCKAITELGLQGIAVGDGSEREKLEKEYTNIKFTGWKKNKEVKEYMQGAKALIFPSLWYETAGLTVLEAQFLGIPCIVNENCAAREFVEITGNSRLFDGIENLKKQIINLDNNLYSYNRNLDNFKSKNYIKKLLEFFKTIN